MQQIILSKPQTHFSRMAWILLILVALSIPVVNFSLATPPIDFLESNSISSNQSTNLRPDYFQSRLIEALKNGSHLHDDNQQDMEISAYAWHKMDTEYRHYMRAKIKRYQPLVHQLLDNSKVSKDCQSAIDAWLKGLIELDLWAIRMWNSWGDLPVTGLFEGSFSDLGSYRDCLAIESNKFIGEPQYCTLDFQPIVPTRPRFHSILKRVLDIDPPKSGHLIRGVFANNYNNSVVFASLSSHGYGANSPSNGASYTFDGIEDLRTETMEEFAKIAQFFYYIKLRTGSCWPTRCNKHEVQSIAKSAATRSLLQLTKTYCVTKSERMKSKFSILQRIAISLLIAFALPSIFATTVDFVINILSILDFTRLSDRMSMQCEIYLDLFSIFRNLQKLISDPSPQSMTALMGNRNQEPARLNCLNGFKIISMIWIIYGHTILNYDYQLFSHAFQTLNEGMTSFIVSPTLNTNFSVDTFFLVSGLLSAYIIFSLNIEFNGLLYTVTRYVRLTPQLFIIILVLFLLPLMGDGPIYREYTEQITNRCLKNFWLNLLYLQTYVNRSEMCMIASWWLSIEMTFHVLSLPIIYALMRSEKLGLTLTFALVTVLSGYGAYIHYSSGFAIQYLPTIPQMYEVETEQTFKFFHRPYPHVTSYFIGLTLGYSLARGKIRCLSSAHRFVGWSGCAIGIIISLWGTYFWNKGAPYTQIQATLYYNLCQIVWPISIAWIILACSLGYGGHLRDMLAAKKLAPLGRITYMTYLSHMIVVYYNAAAFSHTFEPNILNVLYLCVINITLSLLLGMVMSLLYEFPLLNIQKIFYRKMYQRVNQAQICVETHKSIADINS